MADKFKVPTLDWTSPGDLHKRFKIFKQKCELIFDGPLEDKDEDKKAKLLLLWCGDKGLEIYNTATWEKDDDKLIVDKILEKFEQYTKPQSNQILSRYQLRCLKQGDMPLEEFITRARTQIDEAGYNPAFKDEMLRDTLVFGVSSDKVRREAISKGNELTLKQVYDLAKTNESTKSQMEAIAQPPVIHDVKTKKKHQSKGNKVFMEPRNRGSTQFNNPKQKEPHRYKFKFEGCFRCGNKHNQTEKCPATHARCQYCKKEGHFKKVCMKRRLKQVNEIVASPDYKGEDIHIQDDGSSSEQTDTGSEQDSGSSDSELDPITVSIGSIASVYSVDEIDKYPDKLFTTIRVNNKRNMRVKVDTGADTCVLTTGDLQALDLSLNLQPCENKLKGYGGGIIENLGTVELIITFKDISLPTTFNIVNAPGQPSMIGCRQAQQLGMVTVNIQEVRLCLDPKDLNDNIKREHYYTRTIDELLPQLHGKEFFSVADTRKGYWHVELDEESSMLCTFNTPFGRYRFKRLPFGIRVSQDVFQRKLDDVFQGIDNVTNIADDIIIYGSTEEEHDQAFSNMLAACRANNVKLNPEKLQFKKQEVNFFGYTLSPDGISPATDKLGAIKNITPPANVKELQSLLGIITYLNRFSKRLADLTAPLRELTKKNVHFKWEEHHQTALDKIKEELCAAKVLSFYDPNPGTTTILQCDASTKGLGAWLRQVDHNGNEKIVAMASRSLADTETRYSNIERECLAVAFGLKKFEYYLLGRHTLVETDHSPLEQIFKKNINEVPARLQRLVLRCLKFDIKVKYKRGQCIPVADALSRVCIKVPSHNSAQVPDQQTSQVDFITIKTQLVSLEEVKNIAAIDPTMCLLKSTIYQGWPRYRKQCPEELWEYWNYRCDLVLEDGLILKGDKVLIPAQLRKQVLQSIHTGHQGETKCLLLARQSVYWPGLTADVRETVKSCQVCNKFQPEQPKLPLMQPDFPLRPWEKLGADLFHFKGEVYLMVVDYYSRFPVVRHLSNMQAATVSMQFTSILSEYGMPSTVQTDFGSQFTTETFKESCKQCGINLLFSSPYHHQTNGLAEKSVGTCKDLWKKALESNQCPYTAMWIYRTTPIDQYLPSPYELLTGRKPKSLLPSSNSNLKATHPQSEEHQERNASRQITQASFYNKKAAKDQPILPDSQPVYVRNTLKNIWEPGTIVNRPNPEREPRTYAVKLNRKIYTRTRQHLRPMQENNEAEQADGRSTQHPHSAPDVNLSKQMESKSSEVPAESNAILDKTPGNGSFEVKSQTTRCGRVTKVPLRFKD